MSSASIESLYKEHQSWIFTWLYKRLNCQYQAEDLTQDTFLRVVKGNESEIREPRAYLTTIAKGILSNWYQRQSLEQAYLDALQQLPEHEIPSEENRYLILETLHEIDTVLDSLPAHIKQVFLLSQIEGLKYQAIATQMGLSLITVKRYMKKAFTHCLMSL
ncbi:sigma-70 family RNA polymerase sigma factor [Methylophaga thalassica]|uniref:sigma-70 family RNA polymerase sigma factor n=1 Tax=Methylophaga aminisulfidivorans TaxID=230105 RepID=UPI003A905D49